MKLHNHALFWLGVLAALFAFVYVFKGILLPFALGIALAYLLNPLVCRLSRLGLSRRIAAILILGGFLVLFGVIFATLIPVIYRELVDLSQDIPALADKVLIMAEPYVSQFQNFFGLSGHGNLTTVFHNNAQAGTQAAGHVFKGIAAGGNVALDVISLVVFVPIVAYFMICEWMTITQWVDDLMPRDRRDTIKDLLHQIDRKLSGFVRGQISVAFILALGYAIALSLAGLKYGFLIGFSAGLLSIIPMLGSIVGFFAGVLAAWIQTGNDWMFIGLVAGIFIVGQLIEGNLLTPKIVGDKVGLHPLWIFFAILAGGSLFGILGMLLAVPVAAVASVLVAFGIRRYKKSSYYDDTQK
jgi:predicted PurR-regulated permease PerM